MWVSFEAFYETKLFGSSQSGHLGDHLALLSGIRLVSEAAQWKQLS